jgi:hypothetical protein
VALTLDTAATITDRIIGQHDSFLGRLFAEARRKHEQRFVAARKAINDKVRLFSQIGHALMSARDKGTAPYAAIESIVPWEVFARALPRPMVLRARRLSIRCHSRTP